MCGRPARSGGRTPAGSTRGPTPPALREWRGPVLRPGPADGRGEPDGEEVRERGDYACALEVVRCADDKVGYQERAIVAYDEREDDAGELDEEVDDMGLCGRIEHDGEEVGKGAGVETQRRSPGEAV